MYAKFDFSPNKINKKNSLTNLTNNYIREYIYKRDLNLSMAIATNTTKPVAKTKRGRAQEGAGRPKKDITDDQVYKLGLIHCTVEEAAAVLDCSRDTIYARFSDALRRGHQDGQKSLKRKMHEIAMDGNVSMLIWISKQRLGYKDAQPEDQPSTTINVTISQEAIL